MSGGGQRHDPSLDGLCAFVMDVSYFSGKLEAYLRWKEIPYERVEVGWRHVAGEIARETGAAQVPALRLVDGTWLTDSTPIIEWLERRTAGPPVLPDDPADAFIVRLVEDYADEWLWRPALHYRWSFGPDRRLLGERIAREVLWDVPGPVFLKAMRARSRQRARYVTGDGVTAVTRAHCEGIYLRTLDTLERILADDRFLLGARPSLADFGFFASMFRHFSLDPTPARIMRERAARVYAWVARLWAARASTDGGPFLGGIPESWSPLLDDTGEAYLPYLADNARAVADGARRFDHAVQGVVYRGLRPNRYRAWCRERLQRQVEALPDEARARVRTRLERHGCWEPLWRHGRLASGYVAKGQPVTGLRAR